MIWVELFIILKRYPFKLGIYFLIEIYVCIIWYKHRFLWTIFKMDIFIFYIRTDSPISWHCFTDFCSTLLMMTLCNVLFIFVYPLAYRTSRLSTLDLHIQSHYHKHCHVVFSFLLMVSNVLIVRNNFLILRL